MKGSLNTLADVLESLHGTQPGITFIEGEKDESFLPYVGLYHSAKCLLFDLREYGLKPGDELVFQFQSNKKFIISFWACILGKIIPVPLTLSVSDASKLINVWKVLKNPYVITDSPDFKRMLTARENTASTVNMQSRTIFFDELQSSIEAVALEDIEPDDIAFIQFSSGATGNPKGVVNTHFSLLDNIRAILQAGDSSRQNRFLSWMPLTHDMGLIGFHLTPLLNHCSQFLLPTPLFIRRPALWMSKTSEHKINVLGSPNFGYFHFLNNVNEAAISHCKFDSVKYILNGAEPISAKLCREFTGRLSKYGLGKNTIRPTYGLAEATLAVTMVPPREDIVEYYLHRDHLGIGSTIRFVDAADENTAAFVDVGMSIGSRVKIVDSSGNQLPEQTIGHIKLKGDSITPGYYNNLVETSRVISKDGWLDTGDLGFMINHRLVITGRAKDLIIVGGTNYYPHDIERALEGIRGLEINRVAAASIWDNNLGREALILFVRHKIIKNDFSRFISLKNEAAERLFNKMGLKVDMVIPVKRMPKTTSGKLQRFKLVQEYRKGKYLRVIEEIKKGEQRFLPTEPTTPTFDDEEKSGEIRSFLAEKASRLLETREIDLNRGLVDMGFTSLKAVRYQEMINSHFNIKLPISSIFDYPTIPAISKLILKEIKGDKFLKHDQLEELNAPRLSIIEPIAVIGIGCRFPGGADTPDKFWELLKNGVNALTEIPKERMNVEDFYSENQQEEGKMYTKYGSFIEDVDMFDSHFFGITPREAENMDPQQRILLEVCCQSLQNAGISIEKLDNSNTGVFIGISNDDYARSNASNDDYNKINQYTITGSAFSTASGRISYFFGFQGPNYSINTACSSSLAAVHNAVQSLKSGESDIALAGGINLILSPDAFIASCRLTALSKSDRTRPFDDNADGYTRGEGCGIIVLKRFSDAVKDNDNILAVIKGSAVNHDGKSSGLTVPNGLAQEKVIKQALVNARIFPYQVDYIEAHGSGTLIGDPQEVQSLSSVFSTDRENKLIIGSVKSNIGHLEAAAGIAGLVKTILALKHKKIPENLNFKTPNRHTPWDKIQITVANRLTDWNVKGKPRTAGVSSFGLSGTNVHVVLEESPDLPGSQPDNSTPAYIVNISAKTGSALQKLAESYTAFFKKPSPYRLRDISYTSIISRGDWHKRISITGNSKQEIQAILSGYLNEKTNKNLHEIPTWKPGSKKIAFLFPGEGNDLDNAARSVIDLYETVPVFRNEMDRCDKIINTYRHESLLEILKNQNTAEKLNQPLWARLFLFSVEYALAKMWIWFGVMPSIVMGTGIGEYPAACTAGILDVETALRCIHGNSPPPPVSPEAKAELQNPAILFISTAYGKEIPGDELSCPRYWEKEALNTVKQKGVQIFLEMGSHSTSTNPNELWIASLNKNDNPWRQILNSMGELYVNEIDVDWEKTALVIDGKKIVLPNYPFERKRFTTGHKPTHENNKYTITSLKNMENGSDDLMEIIERQFKIMEKQLELL